MTSRLQNARTDHIFVSYRRSDSAGHAGRLYDRLSGRFGHDRVFMDVATIGPGADFVEEIATAIADCGVVIALIGNDWLAAAGDDGQRRIDDPDDFVRQELEQAFSQQVPVIPVLVQRASMPPSGELPDTIRPLGRRHAIELDDARWEHDTQRLIEAVSRYVEPRREGPARRPRWMWVAGAAAVLVAVAAGALALFDRGSPPVDLVPVTHSRGPLEVEVPVMWDDVERSHWLVGAGEGEDAGPALTVAVDAEDYHTTAADESWATSGLFVSASTTYLDLEGITGQGEALIDAFRDQVVVSQSANDRGCEQQSDTLVEDGPSTVWAVYRSSCGDNGAFIAEVWALDPQRRSVLSVFLVLDRRDDALTDAILTSVRYGGTDAIRVLPAVPAA